SYLTAPPRGVGRIIDRQIFLKGMEDPAGLPRLAVRFAAQPPNSAETGRQSWVTGTRTAKEVQELSRGHALRPDRRGAFLVQVRRTSPALPGRPPAARSRRAAALPRTPTARSARTRSTDARARPARGARARPRR